MDVTIESKGMHLLSRKTMLIGTGLAAIAGLSAYLYKKPKLRKHMLKADTMKDATLMLGQEIRHDSSDIAHDMFDTMVDKTLEGAKSARSYLGFSRFDRVGNTAKNEARHLKQEAKASGKRVMDEATA